MLRIFKYILLLGWLYDHCIITIGEIMYHQHYWRDHVSSALLTRPCSISSFAKPHGRRTIGGTMLNYLYWENMWYYHYWWNHVVLTLLAKPWDIYLGPSWSWSFGSWIDNYLWNERLSPSELWVRTSFMVRCTRYNIMW